MAYNLSHKWSKKLERSWCYLYECTHRKLIILESCRNSIAVMWTVLWNRCFLTEFFCKNKQVLVLVCVLHQNITYSNIDLDIRHWLIVILKVSIDKCVIFRRGTIVFN